MTDRERRQKEIQLFVQKMPSLSTTVSKVLEICSRTDTSPNDLNRVISLDPVLTGQVLKLINSAYYSLMNRVTSLTRAIVMLGLNTVKNLALSTAVIGCVKQTKKSRVLPINQFWTHSIAVGVLAKLLASELGIPLNEREEFFVAGLLHDLGKIPMGDEYADVLHMARHEQKDLIKVEKKELDITHEEIGGLIAEKWALSPSLTEVICRHHSLDDITSDNGRLVNVVALADSYACLFDLGYAGNCYPDEERLLHAIRHSELDWSFLSQLKSQVDEEIRKAEVFLRV
ncbi:MAG: HDOD domain-containing protein [Desulfobulbaceae bacterium]|nr:HDOD domain-containing protein [Desulfobulbaceae bacterium]